MNTKTIEDKIEEHIRKNSGLDQNRDYLGISKISDCPRKAYLEYFTGVDLTADAHRMCYTGYEQEKMILQMLVEIGVARPLQEEEKEVVAKFDPRLKGHVDGETVEGDLLEIKSVSYRKFQNIKEINRVLPKHFIQVQLYMLHGRWTQALVVYRCRETYEHIVLKVPLLNVQALKFNQKAARVLECIDKGIMPECECGRCFGLEESKRLKEER